MKQIKIKCFKDGTIESNVETLVFDKENLSTEVIIDMSGLGITDYFKRVNILVGQDKTTDYLPKVAVQGDVYSIILENAHLKKGMLTLQPTAYEVLGLDVKRTFKWEHLKLSVRYAVDVFEDVVIDVSVAEQLQTQVDLMLDRVVTLEHKTLSDFTHGQIGGN